jgi:hypothetical protein
MTNTIMLISTKLEAVNHCLQDSYLPFIFLEELRGSKLGRPRSLREEDWGFFEMGHVHLF